MTIMFCKSKPLSPSASQKKLYDLFLCNTLCKMHTFAPSKQNDRIKNTLEAIKHTVLVKSCDFSPILFGSYPQIWHHHFLATTLFRF